ncbi:hypothetical protein [Candidatus Entotheonella palauensis]|uniref:hypothetical protein n=1 Tax=Candidatus Entotheonella palauensis TaxID=93172 RepID=UPI0011775E39|nr:hypothetical protein [Candidatus Entotheonella palauensis]
MKLQTLAKQLEPDNGTITINTKSLSSAFSDFLSQYFFAEGKVLEIQGAKLTQDASSQTVTVTGSASYLNIPNRPLSAHFWIDGQGNVQTSLTYTMIESATSTRRWAFSNSFPELPLTDIRVKGSKRNEYERLPCFSNFDFLCANVSVCSQAMQDGEFDVPLQEGINFVGQIRPLGLLGIVEHFLNNDGPQTVFGPIIIPEDDTRIVLPNLNQDVSRSTLYPWEIVDYTLPGIHLSMSVPLAFKVGKAEFQDTQIRFYSPLKPDMFEPDSPYNIPVCAFTGTLDIPSADMAMDMIADLDIADSYLNIEGRFENFSLENMAKLASITGSGTNS